MCTGRYNDGVRLSDYNDNKQYGGKCMSDINLMVLGMSGSGKTCFLLAMYYAMSAGVNGYTLSVKDAEDDYELRSKWKNLCELQGKTRFPQGTDKNGDYLFDLEYAYQTIKTFHWMDYRGGSLESRGMDEPNEYEELSRRIKESTCLFIFVDGDNLVGNDREKIINNVRDNCSSKINNYISDYRNENKYLPPIAIIITKYDKCLNWNKEDIFEIISKAFSPLFTMDESKNKVAIIPVSIGKNIEDENYSGALSPINIYQPLFYGIFDTLKKDLNEIEKEQKEIHDKKIITEERLKEKKRNLEEKFPKSHTVRNMFNAKTRATLEDEIKKEEEKLIKVNIEVADVDEKVARYKRYVKKVRHELVGVTVFRQGKRYEIVEGEDYDE